MTRSFLVGINLFRKEDACGGEHGDHVIALLGVNLGDTPPAARR
jgi:hypothetical protein